MSIDSAMLPDAVGKGAYDFSHFQHLENGIVSNKNIHSLSAQVQDSFPATRNHLLEPLLHSWDH